MTRIGDVGLFIGMILIFWHAGSFEYEAIFRAIHTGDLSPTMITITAILIFIGAMGKSGQFPLHTWLPDAMEGQRLFRHLFMRRRWSQPVYI